MSARLVIGDVREVLATIPDGSVDLVLSSWPFLALRSYLPAEHPDKHLEIGSEPTPAVYLDTLLAITAEFRRVLAPHGSICLELGDTYSGSGGAGGDYSDGGLRDGQARFDGSASRAYGTGSRPRPARTRRRSPNTAWRLNDDGSVKHDTADRLEDPKNQSQVVPVNGGHGWPLDKSLTMIPESYRWALAYGRNPFTGAESPAGMWRVRNVIDWCRPNPPVGALGDKVRPSTSDLVWACTARDRWFDLDAVRRPASANTHAKLAKGAAPRYDLPSQQRDGNWSTLAQIDSDPAAGAPPLDHWVIPPGGYSGAHYAVWPPELLVIPIEASCPRRVCRTCGKPSRRITKQPTELRQRHSEFAGLIREYRTKAGLSQRAVDEHFGFNGMCSHWERQIRDDKAQPAYPTPEQWSQLRQLLRIETDAFDDLIEGWRGWSDREMTPEYRAAIERTRSEGFYASTGNDGMARVGVNGRSTTANYATLGWTSCGCPDADGIRLDGFHTGGGWRPGHVLDPFGGSGTTAVVATGHGRVCTLIDLDERNADLARQRVGMFLEVEHHKAEASA